MKTFLLLLILFSINFAQKYYNWESKPAPFYITKSVILSEDDIFIYSSQYGYYSSTDGGENWKVPEGDLPIVHAGLMYSENRLFISIKMDSVTNLWYYSDDLGDVWNDVNIPNINEPTKIISSGSELYTWDLSTSKIYRSTNGGLDWEYYTTCSSNISKLEIANNGVLFSLANRRLMKYTHLSGIWEYVDEYSYTDLEISGDTIVVHRVFMDSGIYFSLDCGDTWNEFLCKNAVVDLYRKENTFYATLYGGGSFNIFEVDLANGDMNQLLSTTRHITTEPRFLDRIIYIARDSLYFQGDEHFPEFKSGLFPLHKNNRWFYHTTTVELPSTLYSSELSEEHIVSEQNIDSLRFFLLSNGQIVHYDDKTNIIMTFDGQQVIEQISFNYTDNYFYPFYLGDNFYKMQSMREIYGHGNFLHLDGIGAFESPESYEYQKDTHYLRNIGLSYSYTYLPGTSRIKKKLEQAVIYDENGDSTKYNNIQYPVIKNNTVFNWEQDSLEVTAFIDHPLNHYVIFPDGNESGLCVIEEAKFRYRYKMNGAFGEIIEATMSLKEIENITATFSTIIPVDTAHIAMGAGQIKVSVWAKTKGIFPFVDSTAWEDISNTPSSLSDLEKKYSYSLSPNYPNPFNPSTRIEFTLPKESEVGISVYNVTGEKLFNVAEGNYKAGRHEVSINMSDYSSGVYFVRMMAGEKIFTNKIMLLK